MIKPLTLLALAATAALAATPGRAAETPPDKCQGRMVITSIWPAGTDEDGYDYIVQIRNNTDRTLTADIVLGGFGEKVTIPAITVPSKPVAPWQSYQTRIGTGKTPDINNGTVEFLYDRPVTGAAAASSPPGGKPFVSLQNCHAD
ncbi:hypothetical protein IAI18_03745 [Acetobacteraceae bacterium H6797]|nr:hypothetical protein [Acetobacteraceae bacterium H6797]